MTGGVPLWRGAAADYAGSALRGRQDLTAIEADTSAREPAPRLPDLVADCPPGSGRSRGNGGGLTRHRRHRLLDALCRAPAVAMVRGLRTCRVSLDHRSL